MGYYTTFYFRARIRRDAEPIRTILKAVAKGEYKFYDLSPAPNHEFFQNDRQGMIMWGRQVDAFPKPDFNEHTGKLTFTCELKNYDSTIEQFLDWIKPAILTPKPLRNYIGWKKGDGWESPRIYLHLTKQVDIIYS